MLKKYSLSFIFIILISICFSGCGFSSKEVIPRETESSLRNPTDKTEDSSASSTDGTKTTLLSPNAKSTWVVYWDENSAKKELGQIEDLSAISVFGIYFNDKNEFIIPDLVKNRYEQGKKRYLSFVNDKVNTDKTSSLKDLTILESLIGTTAAQNKHAEAVINLAKKYNYDGIEIDYENLNKQPSLWPLFAEFIKNLYQKALSNKLDVRVVLEPSIDFQGIGFPQGPEYVIMCYNLHGDFSMEEGPKADFAFLDKVMEDSSSLKRRTMAFATGGYDWYGTDVTEVTELAAVAACKKYQVTPLRDTESQALSFSYQDEKGVSHNVWYADDVTLNQWKQRVKAKGDCGFALWRIGGNQLSTIKKVFS